MNNSSDFIWIASALYIKEVYYELDTNELFILMSNGGVIGYEDIPAELAHDFVNIPHSQEITEFYTNFIREEYRDYRLEITI